MVLAVVLETISLTKSNLGKLFKSSCSFDCDLFTDAVSATVSFNQGLIEASDNNIIAAGDSNGFVGIVGPGSDNLVSGVDSWQSDSLAHLGFNKVKGLVSEIHCNDNYNSSRFRIWFGWIGIGDCCDCIGRNGSTTYY